MKFLQQWLYQRRTKKLMRQPLQSNKAIFSGMELNPEVEPNTVIQGIVMEEPTVEGFVDFVQGEPGDRPITHNGFAACAIGEYFKAIGYESFLAAPQAVQRGFIDSLMHTYPDVMEVYDSVEDAPKRFPTYGDLANALTPPHKRFDPLAY